MDQNFNNYLDTEHLKSDLKGRSVRGGTITMTFQVISFFIQMGSMAIMARLLTPQDFGLLAMVTAITGFAALFKDLGLSSATIQKENISHPQVSNLFWINLSVGVFLALILALTAPIIASFYGEQRLVLIVLALAGTFILSGLTIQHQALLMRQMQFNKLAFIELTSLVISIITGITFAWLGTGYWALVGVSAAYPLSYMILVWIFCPWRPALFSRGSGTRYFIKFGGHITGFNIVNYFARNFDNILLGRFLGANVVGLYNRAYNIMMLPINQVRNPLNSVALPALSHVQNNPVRFKKYYIKLLTVLAFVTMPMIAFLFVCADQAIEILLGSQWSEAAGIFRILCIAGFLQPVLSTSGLVLVSLGQTKRYFKIGIFNSFMLVISFILGLSGGAIGVASAYAIANIILFWPTLWLTFKFSPMSIKNFLEAISLPFVSSIISALFILAIRPYMTKLADLFSFGICFVIGLLVYGLSMISLPGGVSVMKEFYSYRLFLFQKKSIEP